MSENESISDEQLSIIANITDLENRVEELHGVVKQGQKNNDITKRVEKLEKKLSKLNNKLQDLEEIGSLNKAKKSTSPVYKSTSNSLSPSNMSNCILFIGFVAILFFIMLK